MLFLPASAQYRVSSSLFKPEAASPGGLFLNLLPDSLKSDSSKSQPPTLSDKSPTTAVLLSSILPGAGQIYTGKYWKVPIIVGFGGYFVSQWLRADDHYDAARTKYRASVERGENNGQGNPQFQYERDFYRDERDRFAFYIVITYLLNIVDAYVDASLFHFDVGDNLTGGASLKLSVPIR